jgi:Holliday junction resolvasome RuvABC endonuclease subunit
MASLDELRARVKEPKPGKKKVWVAPYAFDFGFGRALAFDQTLTKTGWVLLGYDQACDGLGIYAGGVLVPEVHYRLDGFERTFAKAEVLAEKIDRVVGRFAETEARPDVIVHEMPAVRGHRLESSLMAAREIRRVAKSYDIPVVMVNRQAAYALLTGDRHNQKRAMTRVVTRLVPAFMRETERWTQDVHDAAGLALTWLHGRERNG